MYTPNPAIVLYEQRALAALLLALVLLIAALWRWRIGRPQRALGVGAFASFGLGLALLFTVAFIH